MSNGPSEEDIESLCNIGTIARSEAILRLKGNNHNLQQALNEYFDDPDPSKYKWDESAFASDRDGAANPSITFSVDASEPGSYNQGRFDGAPSRPPSRTSNNKSPAGVIDLTEEHARADPNNSLARGQGQDDELERALRESRELAGLPPQETGITSASDPYFGPATRTEYEQGQWELVPVVKDVPQEIPEPEPAARKREADAPAFLRSTADDHRLAALLTIYHEIPLSRYLFLEKADQPAHYGYDNQWWAGRPIEQSRVHGSDIQDISSEDRKFTEELQRLMAFLDKTERAYGSVDALTKTSILKKEVRSGPNGKDMESAFFDIWKEIFKGQGKLLSNLFSKGIAYANTPDEQDKDFAILDLTLPAEESLFETLYDIADEVLWPLMSLDYASSAYLEHIGEIVAFRMMGNERSNPRARDGSKGIDVPTIWYPDRYMEAARQASLGMRSEKSKIIDELKIISEVESNLTYMPYRDTHLKVGDMFKAALQHDKDEIDDKDDLQMALGNEDHVLPVEPAAKGELSRHLQAVMDSIDTMLRSLEIEKQKAYETLKQVSKLFTEPSTNPNAPVLHKYTLRGVSTSKNQTYVCRRGEPDLIDMDLDGDFSTRNNDQWWSITYGASETRPVLVEKTTPEHVLEAAKSESKHVLLIYASQEAMETKHLPLTPGLETFVQEDNQAFHSEFPSIIEDSQQTTSTTSPRSPQKRKYAGSQDGQEMSRWNNSGSGNGNREGSQGGSEGEVTVTSTEIESQDGGEGGTTWSFVGSGEGSERSQSQGLERGYEKLGEGRGSDDDFNHNDVKKERREMAIIEGVDPLIEKDGEGDRMVEMEEWGGARLMGAGGQTGAGGRDSTMMEMEDVLEHEGREGRE